MTSWLPFDVLDHLWQSTLFAGAVWLVALTLRANGARVRYWLWFAASMKFLIPLSLLVSVGERFAWRTEPVAAPPVVSFVIDQLLTPAGTARSATIAETVALGASIASPATAMSWLLVVAWAAGVSFVLISWWKQWLPFRRARAEAHAIDVSAEYNAVGLTIMASPSMIEPGVFGIRRPVLLVPEGIDGRLSPAQLRALIAHEHCHVRHRDNLTATLHMAVEAVFWFHPVVWWIERRLIDERERACDEYVLQCGSTPHDYAEGILEVCRFGTGEFDRSCGRKPAGRSAAYAPLYCASAAWLPASVPSSWGPSTRLHSSRLVSLQRHSRWPASDRIRRASRHRRSVRVRRDS